MAKKHVVATVSEIPPGGRKLVEADGRTIVVFNLSGEFFALSNRMANVTAMRPNDEFYLMGRLPK